MTTIARPPVTSDPDLYLALMPLLRWQCEDPGNEDVEPEEREQAINDLRSLDHWIQAPPASGTNLAEPDALLRFFLRHLWADFFPPGFVASDIPAEQAELIRAGSALALHVLGGLPIEERTIAAMVWSVARYAHDVLHVEPRLDLASHLMQAARNEPALHSLKLFYRDHFFHSLEVCFLGHYLLEHWETDDGRLLDVTAAVMNLTTQEVLRQWYVAALLHDNGYAVEVLASARAMLGFYKRSDDLRGLAEGIGTLIEGFSTKLGQSRYMDFEEKDNPGWDHGVFSATHLDALMEHVSTHKAGTGSYAVAARAMAVHNHRKPTIDFAEEPLSYLLILCDTLQEWNRPHLRYALAPSTMLTRLSPHTHIEETAGTIEGFTIDFVRSTGTAVGKAVFRLKYSQEVNRNSGVFHLWLDTTSNLQRLKHTGLRGDIEVHLATPTPISRGRQQTGGPLREYQMHRLIEAAHETHMNFLAEWFPSRGNLAVRHHPNDLPAQATETLTLHLRALSNRRLMTASMKTFNKFLSRWRRYNEDREFSGDYAAVPPG